MPRGNSHTQVGTKTKYSTGGSKKTSQELVKIKNNHDSDTDNESLDENKQNIYDATLHDNGADKIDDKDDLGGDDKDTDDLNGDDDIDNYDNDEIDINGAGGENNGDDDCSYNMIKKIKGVKKLGSVIDKEDDDDEGVDINVDENEFNSDLYIKPEDRRSVSHLTQYERVRILGDRTAQLAQGAKPMIKGADGMEPRIIAQLELESKMIPIKIIRPLPYGKKEIWSLSELRLKKKYIIYGFIGGVVDGNVVKKIREEYQNGGSIIGYRHLTN